MTMLYILLCVIIIELAAIYIDMGNTDKSNNP